MKTCSKCRAHLPLESFYKNRAQKDGLHNWCKQCFNTANVEYQSRPEVDRARKARSAAYSQTRVREKYTTAARVLQNYGLTPVEQAQILAAQEHVCAICGTPEPGGRGGWHVDHDHKCCPGARSCGKCVRGFLCARCNPMLGMAQDDISILLSAVDYLSRTSALASAIDSPV